MAPRRTKSETAAAFGGDWTEVKLRILSGYLSAYTTALKNQPFSLDYIDAFAGSGYRRAAPGTGGGEAQAPLFPDLAESEPQKLLVGSAIRALQTQPPFDSYIFIEKDAARCEELERVAQPFNRNVKVICGDANLEVSKLCDEDWTKRRAVMFLDPFGMAVDWATVEAIARTKAIDLWLLVPLGIGVNRLLTKDPNDIPAGWRSRLTAFLGTEEWEKAIYVPAATPRLFGDDTGERIKAAVKAIGAYFVGRLRSVFAGVAEPKVLYNSTNSPLYLLCFAVGNDRGAKLALKIASHLLGGGKHGTVFAD